MPRKIDAKPGYKAGDAIRLVGTFTWTPAGDPVLLATGYAPDPQADVDEVVQRSQ